MRGYNVAPEGSRMLSCVSASPATTLIHACTAVTARPSLWPAIGRRPLSCYLASYTSRCSRHHARAVMFFWFYLTIVGNALLVEAICITHLPVRSSRLSNSQFGHQPQHKKILWLWCSELFQGGAKISLNNSGFRCVITNSYHNHAA